MEREFMKRPKGEATVDRSMIDLLLAQPSGEANRYWLELRVESLSQKVIRWRLIASEPRDDSSSSGLPDTSRD